MFGDHDEVAGIVLLDPRRCTSPGRITVTASIYQHVLRCHLTCKLKLDGKFVIGSSAPHDGRRRGTQQHTFLTSSQIFDTAESNASQTPTTLRGALANTVRPKPWRTRATSVSSNNGFPPNLFPFKFDIPQGQRGQEMPPSFNLPSVAGGFSNEAERTENAEVSYTITALWEASSGLDRALCVLLSFPR